MFNVHIDRAISVYLCHPFSRRLDGGRRPRIPILMYHSIGEGTEGRHPYYETHTSPRVFAQHMKFLRDNGYSSISLGEATDSLAAGRIIRRSVVITFDDGYLDFYSHAYPILCEHGFTATVFVVTGLLKTQRAHFNGKECLTLSEVRELHSKGIGIGSHTVTHPELKFLKLDEVDNEITESKRTLEDAIGAPVKSFSYPFAFPEADRGFISCLEKILNKSGYQNGVSTVIGTAQRGDNRFFLPRLPVNSWDDLRFFQAKLEGGYDWLHFPQWVYKKLGHQLRSLQGPPARRRSPAEQRSS
jgi:peptidoglycan/xylan/chitin deacetylase (PgdA/CDA1 family)